MNYDVFLVKRSSSSSSEASKVSTIGTVSNTFEIVTVTPRKYCLFVVTLDRPSEVS